MYKRLQYFYKIYICTLKNGEKTKFKLIFWSDITKIKYYK